MKTGPDELAAEAAEAAVAAQLSLLAAGDVVGAFAWNSAANKDRWCGPTRFETILRGHPTFRRLLPPDQEPDQQPQESLPALAARAAPAATVVPGSSSCAPRSEQRVGAKVTTTKSSVRTVHVQLPPEKTATATSTTGASPAATGVLLEWTMVFEGSAADIGSTGWHWRTEKVGLVQQ